MDLDAPLSRASPKGILPFLQQRGNHASDLAAIPSLQDSLSFTHTHPWYGVKLDDHLSEHGHLRPTSAVDDAQSVALSQEAVVLTADHLPRGLSWLLGESGAVALDPAQHADHRQAHRLVAQAQRHGHANVRSGG